MRKIDRFIKYMSYKGLNDNQVTRECELSQGLLNQARSGKSDLGTKAIDKILIKYQDLNRVWLLTGEGEMLVNATEVVKAEEIKGDVLPVKCDKQTLGHCRATMPFVSNDLAQSRDIDIRRLVLFEPDKLEQFTLAKVFRGVDYIQRVITEAMEPYYFPGDYLLVSFLPLQGDIISGATYLLDTKVYGTMLRKVIVRKEGYLLKPHNAEFDEVLLKREDVYSISIVVSMFRTNTNLTLASNLATLVKNRDEQIKRMVETQQKILDELCRQNERLDKERERTERERERTDKLIEKIINQ